MKGLVFDTENRMQFKDFGEPLLDSLQKEALSAQGWDFRLYLCVRDTPDFMELVNRTTGKYVMFRK